MLSLSYILDMVACGLDVSPDCGTRAVHDRLIELFPRRVVGHPVVWPPHSPDLTPFDFLFRGYIKSTVYTTPPRTLHPGTPHPGTPHLHGHHTPGHHTPGHHTPGHHTSTDTTPRDTTPPRNTESERTATPHSLPIIYLCL